LPVTLVARDDVKVQVKGVLLRLRPRTVDDLGVLETKSRLVQIDTMLHCADHFQEFRSGNVNDVS